MWQDESHRLLREIGLPEIVDVFWKTVLVGPAFRIHVQQRRVDIVAVGAMVSVEPDDHVVLSQRFAAHVRLMLPQLCSGDLAAWGIARLGAEFVVVKCVPAAYG